MLAAHSGKLIFCLFAKVWSYLDNMSKKFGIGFYVKKPNKPNRITNILLCYVNFFLKGLGKCIYTYYEMMGHLDLSWSINSPGESIRFILVKIISSKYVGYNNNNNNLKSIISVYSLFACLYLPARTYFEYPEILLSVNKLEGFCSPICSWRTSRNNKRVFFVLFQERKQSIWSLKGVTHSNDWCFIFLQRVGKWHGFIVPWLKSPLLK